MTPRSVIPEIILTGRDHHPTVADYLALGSDFEVPSHFDRHGKRRQPNQGKRARNNRSSVASSGKAKATTSFESTSKQHRMSINGAPAKNIPKDTDTLEHLLDPTSSDPAPSYITVETEPVCFSQGTRNRLHGFRYHENELPVAEDPLKYDCVLEGENICPSSPCTSSEACKSDDVDIDPCVQVPMTSECPPNDGHEPKVCHERATSLHSKSPDAPHHYVDRIHEPATNDWETQVENSSNRIPNSLDSDRTMGFTDRASSPPAMNTDSEDIFDCLDTLSPRDLARLEEICDSTQRDIDECHNHPSDPLPQFATRGDLDDFDDGLDDSDLLEIADSEPAVLPKSVRGFPRQLRRLTKPFKPLVPQTTSSTGHIVGNSSGIQHQPIVRPPFPPATRDRSPIIGLSSKSCLRTCFRVGEAIKAGCGAVRQGKDVLIELYARVAASWREEQGVKQHFVFCDLYHDHKPFINGVFELWKGCELWDVDSSRFLKREKVMCRCIGKMRRDGADWKMTILSIFEVTWDDVEYVRGIVCA